MTEALQGEYPRLTYRDLVRGQVQRLFLRVLDENGALSPLLDISGLFELTRDDPTVLRWLSERLARRTADLDAARARGLRYFETLDRVSQQPGLIDFIATGVMWARHDPRAPFDRAETLPPTVPAAPRRRAALFLHNSYYHFKY